MAHGTSDSCDAAALPASRLAETAVGFPAAMGIVEAEWHRDLQNYRMKRSLDAGFCSNAPLLGKRDFRMRHQAADGDAPISRDRCRLYASAANHAYQNHDDRKNQQQVDETSQRVRRHQSQEPENQQHDGDSFQHVDNSFGRMKSNYGDFIVFQSESRFRTLPYRVRQLTRTNLKLWNSRTREGNRTRALCSISRR
jgi:hypothetical protein